MRSGYFVGPSGAILIRDHACDLRANHTLLKRLGLSAAKVKELDEMYPENREDFLVAVLEASEGLCRVRGHGEFSSVEYFGREELVVKGLVKFGRKYLCPDSLLKLVDLKTLEEKWMKVCELEEVRK